MDRNDTTASLTEEIHHKILHFSGLSLEERSLWQDMLSSRISLGIATIIKQEKLLYFLTSKLLFDHFSLSQMMVEMCHGVGV